MSIALINIIKSSFLNNKNIKYKIKNFNYFKCFSEDVNVESSDPSKRE